MIKKQTKGKIFLAEERGLNELKWFQSRNSFNFGKYYNEHKHPFKNLYVLNDDSLAGGHSMKMITEENFYVILLPVIGAIAYGDDAGNKNLLAAGQAQIILAEKPITYQIANPFPEETVNFLQLWIKAGKNIPSDPPLALTYKDVNKNINQPADIFLVNEQKIDLPFSVSIGKFAGRGGYNYILNKKNSGLFVFVLTGAFEVEGRLLHARDGLSLWESDEVEMEALSNDAIVLLIEL